MLLRISLQKKKIRLLMNDLSKIGSLSILILDKAYLYRRSFNKHLIYN